MISNELFTLKTGLAEMLKGGVIMDVTNAEQAEIAQEAGAVAVMALERVPADIRVQGGVARMSDPEVIQRIIKDKLQPALKDERTDYIILALLTLVVTTLKPDVTISKLQEVVHGTSGYLVSCLIESAGGSN